MADSDLPPHRLYREMVKQTLFRYVSPPGVDPEVALRLHLEKLYAEESAALNAAIAASAPQEQIMARRNGVFVLAAGLFAFGRIDVAEDLVEHLPPSGNVRRLAMALKALLPIPLEMDPLREPEGMAEWLRANASELGWDESAGRYVPRSA